MGTFANIPDSKYDSLSEEDKKKVDAYRSGDGSTGNFADVMGREENTAVEKPATRKGKTS